MATVKAFIRTGKKDDLVNIRFRLSDGRNIQLFHVSDIMVNPSLWDAKKEEYKRETIPAHYTSREALYKYVSDRKYLILKLYSENNIKSSDELNQLVDKTIHPEDYTDSNITNLLQRFRRYTEQSFKDGILGIASKKYYEVLGRELHRFLIIENILNINTSEFTSNHVILFKDFLLSEHTYVDKYKGLYVGMNARNIPSKQRGQNTVAVKLKKLQAFFNELENIDEIEISPFRKINRKRKAAILKETYDDPTYLTKDEYLRILNMPVPEILQETKDVFLLQCSFGCRIGDFSNLSYDNISIESGIPYIHYIPKKTSNIGSKRKEIQTPIIKRSLETIQKYNFTFPILKYVSGERGYNAKIKQLLAFCKIGRLVAKYDKATNTNEYMSMHETSSSKMARKTHIDMLNKVQINQYAAGLHKEGSKAVNRYTFQSIEDRFILMCAAFDDVKYKVDSDLNITHINRKPI